MLAQTGEVYVLAQSQDRVNKERSMRRRQLKWLCGRLQELQGMELKRDERLMKLGAAKQQAPSAWRFVEIKLSEAKKQKQKKRKRKSRSSPSPPWSSNYAATSCGSRGGGKAAIYYGATCRIRPRCSCGNFYLQLGQVEQAFKHLKGDLAVRPFITKRGADRSAHFPGFSGVLFAREFGATLEGLGPGLTPRSSWESWPRCK